MNVMPPIELADHALASLSVGKEDTRMHFKEIWKRKGKVISDMTDDSLQ